MLIARDQLLDALSLIRKVVPQISHLPTLGHLLLEPSADDHSIQVSATNRDIDISITLDRYDRGESFDTLLPISTLWEIIPKCQPGSSVQIDLVDREKILLTYGVRRSSAGASCQLRPLPVEDFPQRLAGTFTKPQILPRQFVTDIQRALSHASSDESRYVLSSVYLHMPQPGLWRAVGADGRRMFASGSHRLLWLKPPVEYPPSDEVPRGPGGPVDGDPAGWLLPAKTAEILAHLEQPLSLTFATSNRFARFTAARTTVTSKLIEGRFPNYQQVLATQPAEACDGVWTLAGTDHDIAIALIDALPTHKKTDAVRLILQHGHLVAEALDPSETITRVGLPGTFAGQPKAMSFDRHLLRDTIAARPAQIRLRDHHHAAVALDLTGATMLLMGLRDPNEAEEKKAA